MGRCKCADCVNKYCEATGKPGICAGQSAGSGLRPRMAGSRDSGTGTSTRSGAAVQVTARRARTAKALGQAGNYAPAKFEEPDMDDRDSMIQNLTELGFSEDELESASDELLQKMIELSSDDGDQDSDDDSTDQDSDDVNDHAEDDDDSDYMTREQKVAAEAKKVGAFWEANSEAFTEASTSKEDFTAAFKSMAKRQPGLKAVDYCDPGGRLRKHDEQLGALYRSTGQEPTPGSRARVDPMREASQVSSYFERFAETFERTNTTKEEFVDAFWISSRQRPGLTAKQYLTSAFGGR